jgi:hypothetical protein
MRNVPDTFGKAILIERTREWTTDGMARPPHGAAGRAGIGMRSVSRAPVDQ